MYYAADSVARTGREPGLALALRREGGWARRQLIGHADRATGQHSRELIRQREKSLIGGSLRTRRPAGLCQR